MQSAVLAVVNPSVRPSVRLCTMALCQNNSSYDLAVFSGVTSHDSSFFLVNFIAKSQGDIGNGVPNARFTLC